MSKVSEQKEKHLENLKKEDDKKRKMPLREVPMSRVPSSAYVILEGKEWYRNFAKLSLFGLLISLVCATVASLALAYVMTRPPETLSYLMDEDGRIVQFSSVRDPDNTESDVLNWATARILDMHKLTFNDYMNHVGGLRNDFAPEAFIEYQNALISSKSLEKVKNDQLVMWAEPLEAPRITMAKVVNGKFTWVVEMKIVQYMGGGKYTSTGTTLKSRMVIERTSRAHNLAGLVISKYLAEETR